MGRYSGKTCRLLTMLAMTASFFLVEIIVGYISNSIALIADSFHMLSDVVALVVGFSSVRVSKWKTKKNTFGWQRAEVLGALVNTVFLIALCFTIVVNSLQRFITIEKVERPILLLVVGALGLVVNLIGLCLFQSHGHSHGGHSHGGGGHNDMEEILDEQQIQINQEPSSCNGETVVLQVDALLNQPGPTNPGEHGVIRPKQTNGHGHGHSRGTGGSQLNMKGVFLHVLGDALGSVVVIISALIIWLAEGEWRYYVDPGLSVFMVFVILASAIPLLKETSLILLQTVPAHIRVCEMQKKLIQEIEGVLDVHEFHVWRLAGDRIIVSAHIRCRNLHEYVKIAEDVKQFFHKEGIHSTTIQPEFAEMILDGSQVNVTKIDRDCALECGPDKNCYPNTCCGPSSKNPPKSDLKKSPSSDKLPHGHTNRLSTVSRDSLDDVTSPSRDHAERDQRMISAIPRIPPTPALAPAKITTVSAPGSPERGVAPLPSDGPVVQPPDTRRRSEPEGHETSV